MNFKIITYLLCSILSVSSCTMPIKEVTQLQEHALIYPDYMDVTIPTNIAPLNFRLENPGAQTRVQLTFEQQTIEIVGKKGNFKIPERKWKRLIESAKGKSIYVTVLTKEESSWYSYKPFTINVVESEIDPYVAYRLIEPGYESWNRMGIYQRNLENYTETAIIENKMTDNSCMNCHSFCNQDPEKMLLHLRGSHSYTMLINDGEIEKLDTKTPQTISPFVYPSWHPSGDLIAFSVNKTAQSFHTNDKNRVEVYDLESDIILFDVKTQEIITTPLLFSKVSFETFPNFAPDGKTLYFCTADARDIPKDYDSVKYNICSISFDAETRQFGDKVDTLYNANKDGKSASFPRVSPDGKYLLYTLSEYGNFSIWHKSADLHLIDLSSNEHLPMHTLNSPDVESYHSWSSNSRWVVFSSRREDGLYTRPYIAYIDKDGKGSKPFIMPQKDTYYYERLMKSYNIPEFITGKVKKQGFRVNRRLKDKSQKI